MIATHTYVFIHVPKTGGASIEQALGHPLSGPLHGNLESVIKGNRKAFGFVRNPWDRLVSLYSYLCQKDMPPQRLELQVLAGERGFKWWLTDGQTRSEEQAHSLRSQLWWLNGCDRFGRFESLQADFDSICADFGIKTKTLPHINKSRPDHYSAYYDDDSRRFVEKYYAPEIDMFKYRFEK